MDTHTLNTHLKAQSFDYFQVVLPLEVLPDGTYTGGTRMSRDYADKELALRALAHIQKTHPKARLICCGLPNLDESKELCDWLANIKRQDAALRDQLATC